MIAIICGLGFVLVVLYLIMAGGAELNDREDAARVSLERIVNGEKWDEQ